MREAVDYTASAHGRRILIRVLPRIPMRIYGPRIGWTTQHTLLILHLFILQGMDSFGQLSQGARLNGVFTSFEIYDCALGNSGLTRETPSRLPFCTRGTSRLPGR